jgi:signal transduction histidine kinase/CheY-like chemotaxis protein
VERAPEREDVPTHVEVGSAVRGGPDARSAASAAVDEALRGVRRHAPSALFLFASMAHDLDEVVRGARSVAGDVPILGASTAGEICGTDHARSVVACVIASPFLSVRVGVGAGVSRDWSAALEGALAAPGLAPHFDGGTRWAELSALGRGAFAVLLSPGNARGRPTRSFELVEALKRRSLGRLPIFGGCAADDWRLERNAVLSSEGAVEDGVLVASFETELQFGIGLAHGLSPTGARAIVTEADGAEVVTLDGQPAAEVYARMVGTTPDALAASRHVTLSTGLVLGTRDLAGAHVPHTVSWVTPRGGLLVSRPVSPGTELAVLEVVSETAEVAGPDAIRKACLRGGIARPALALLSYCALRPKLLGDAWRGELARIGEALHGAPAVGFQSFGEQAPSDDGVCQHTNVAIAGLVLGHELSAAAQAVSEIQGLRRESEALRRRSQQDLERLVAERTASLVAANAELAREVEQRRRAEAVAHRHERALRTLGASSDALVRAADERTLLEEVCRVAVEVGGYRMAWVGMAEQDERRTIRPAASWGDHDGYVDSLDLVWADATRGRGPVGTAIRLGRPALARRIETDPFFSEWRERAQRRGFASMAALPLQVEGTAIGALALYSADVEALGDEREVRLLAELADNLALGVQVLRHRAERADMRARLVEADRLAAVGTLAAGIAHEINNPLVYLLGGIEFLETQLAECAGAPDDARSVLGEMRRGGDRIRTIVRDLRTFARCGDETRAAVDVRAVAESSLQLATHEVARCARVVREYGPVPKVLASEARLGQVLLNLLVNAAHAIAATPGGTGEIRITTRTDAAGRAVVEIGDSGAGIRPEVRGRIFEPFFTTKPQGVGTGLGLWISRNIVVGLGGDIEVDTAVGRGTTFRVTLPPAPHLVAAREASTSVRAPPAAARARVLVVDDELLVANALRRALQGAHDVAMETSAEAALQRLVAGERFDAILCDLMMPGMTGMELHARLARLDPAQAERVVFITGGVFTGEAERYLASVPNRRIDKPFEVPQLLAMIAEAAGAGRSGAAARAPAAAAALRRPTP